MAAARRQGWSWQEIAAALEVSEQAVHEEHAGRVPVRGRRGTEAVWVFERSTRAAREVVRQAKVESEGARAGHVGTEHLLLGLLDPEAGLSRDVLEEAGVDAARVREAIAAAAAPPPGPVLGPEDAAALRQVGIDLDEVLRGIEGSFGADALRPAAPAPRKGMLRRGTGSPGRFTPRARKVLELSLREATHLGHREIGGAHILLWILREGDGRGAEVLADSGVDLEALRASLLGRLPRAA